MLEEVGLGGAEIKTLTATDAAVMAGEQRHRVDGPKTNKKDEPRAM